METMNIMIEPHIKEAAQELFERLGIDMSTAIAMFLRQSVYQNSLVLNPKRNQVTFGSMKDKNVWMADDFDAPMEEFEEYV